MSNKPLANVLNQDFFQEGYALVSGFTMDQEGYT